jgi:hypothetical protein
MFLKVLVDQKDFEEAIKDYDAAIEYAPGIDYFHILNIDTDIVSFTKRQLMLSNDVVTNM